MPDDIQSSKATVAANESVPDIPEFIHKRISLLFLVSGIAAILYQLIWQRALFLIDGTNSESITMIVAVFLLGLGIGSLAGGALSRNPRFDSLKLFAIAETGIGLFGLASLPLLTFLAETTAGVSVVVGGVIGFAMLLIPTTLMGATLPLLTQHLVKIHPHVGSVVGDLYYVNTLGSALGCLLAVFVLFYLFGLDGTIVVSAALNFVVVGLAMHAVRRGERGETT
mgnify:CR=1 FL=1